MSPSQSAKLSYDGKKSMDEGFTGTLDQLVEYLAKAQS